MRPIFLQSWPLTLNFTNSTLSTQAGPDRALAGPATRQAYNFNFAWATSESTYIIQLWSKDFVRNVVLDLLRLLPASPWAEPGVHEGTRYGCAFCVHLFALLCSVTICPLCLMHFVLTNRLALRDLPVRHFSQRCKPLLWLLSNIIF